MSLRSSLSLGLVTGAETLSDIRALGMRRGWPEHWWPCSLGAHYNGPAAAASTTHRTAVAGMQYVIEVL